MPKGKRTSSPRPEAFAAARAAAREYTDVVLRFPNVIGCGVGRRITGGRQTDEWCLVTFVSRKLPLTMLRSHEVIPAELDTLEGSVRTDVVQRDPPELFDSEKYRPLLGGCQISSSGAMGTLGAVVYDATDYQPVLLTCNHCLTVAGSRSLIPGDARIRQPAFVWGPPTTVGASGAGAAGPVVGSTKRIVPWLPRPLGQTERDYGLEARVDAGIVKLDQNIDADFRVIGLGRHPYVILPPYPGLEVVKRGYRTEFTIGTVLEIDVTQFQLDRNGQVLKLGGPDSGFTIKAPDDAVFSLPGDSGSLIVDADLGAARGLLWGGNGIRGGITSACELGAVFEMLQLETPCMGGLHSMVRRAVFRRHFDAAMTVESGRHGFLQEMIRKTDRFRDRYLSDVPDGHVSGAFGHMLQTLATELAYQVYVDEDFAGLLDEAFGDWLVQPTVYDMLEYRLSDNFADRVLKAFGRLRERYPDAKGLDWLQSALAGAAGHSMREFLAREVPIEKAQRAKSPARRKRRAANV